MVDDLQFNKVVEVGDVLRNHSDVVPVKGSTTTATKNKCSQEMDYLQVSEANNVKDNIRYG